MLKPTQRSKEIEMSASLTLNKITAQKGITIAEAASRVADLGWTPSYVQEAMTFPTDYKISKTPRDPMRQVLRSYFPMQEEKDNRVYGALDAALRGDMFRNVRAALGRVDEAVFGDHPVPGNLGGAFDGDGRSAGARRGTAHRVYHADGRRAPALDDSDEPEEMVHGKLYRSRRVRYYRSCVRQMLRHHHRPSVR